MEILSDCQGIGTVLITVVIYKVILKDLCGNRIVVYLILVWVMMVMVTQINVFK
jgi:hypothetical protein